MPRVTLKQSVAKKGKGRGKRRTASRVRSGARSKRCARPSNRYPRKRTKRLIRRRVHRIGGVYPHDIILPNETDLILKLEQVTQKEVCAANILPFENGDIILPPNNSKNNIYRVPGDSKHVYKQCDFVENPEKREFFLREVRALAACKNMLTVNRLDKVFYYHSCKKACLQLELMCFFTGQIGLINDLGDLLKRIEDNVFQIRSSNLKAIFNTLLCTDLNLKWYSIIFKLVVTVRQLHTEKTLIHRDIKTENMLIDNELNMKLTDFGFARFMDEFIPDQQLRKSTGRVYYTDGHLPYKYCESGKLIVGEHLDTYACITVLGALIYKRHWIQSSLLLMSFILQNHDGKIDEHLMSEYHLLTGLPNTTTNISDDRFQDNHELQRLLMNLKLEPPTTTDELLDRINPVKIDDYNESDVLESCYYGTFELMKGTTDDWNAVYYSYEPHTKLITIELYDQTHKLWKRINMNVLEVKKDDTGVEGGHQLILGDSESQKIVRFHTSEQLERCFIMFTQNLQKQVCADSSAGKR